MSDEKHILIGKAIAGIKIADDRKAIRFDFVNGGSIIARTFGDCCSESWIEHISLPLKFPAIVADVNEIVLVNDSYDGDFKDEYVDHYGLKITTNTGVIDIDYRNSSNGFYGGCIMFDGYDDDCFWGGVDGQNNSTENFIDVIKDE